MNPEETLRTMRFNNRKAEKHAEINEKMLSEMMVFEEAHKEVTGIRGARPQMRTYSRTEIIEENRLMFDEIGADRKKPYIRIEEAIDATILVGDEERPDWPTRLNAIKLKLQLIGADPKQGITVNIGGNQMNVTVDRLYAMMGTTTNEEKRIDAYNELLRAEKQGLIRPMVNVTPPVDD